MWLNNFLAIFKIKQKISSFKRSTCIDKNQKMYYILELWMIMKMNKTNNYKKWITAELRSDIMMYLG